MADIEKVIKGLEELEGFLFKEYTNRKAEESKIYYDRFKSLSDAIELLKEYKRQDGCPCTHCMEWECDEVCEEYKQWRDS